MRQQILLPAAARLWPKPRAVYRAPAYTAQLHPPTRVFRRFYSHPTPPKNPFLTRGEPPAPGKHKYFAVTYLFYLPIPRTEILNWLESGEEGRKSRALLYIFDLSIFVLVASVSHLIWCSIEPYLSKPFDPLPRFTEFSIVSEESVSSTSKILTIRRKATFKSDPYATYWKNGLWSVEFKQPLLQIARSYTPLPPDENAAIGDLRFLIRKEPNGEMSNYLFGLPAKSQVELRGPHVEFDLPQNVEEVVFLAGGTGIAPALQLVHTLLEARKSNGKRPQIRVLWASRKREDCVGGEKYNPDSELNTDAPEHVGPIVQQLQRLQQKYPENLRVDYLVDEEGKFIDQRMISQATQPSDERSSELVATESNTKLFFVSGPEGFISHFAGPKRWFNGKQEQGELGGVLGDMRIDGWEVFKL
ncbi:hypothetical protein DSL72_007257 [Monilinia vaccinii-corymbosi]|uniref:FAD-binding FR-type domain-containing protein n=1 Tax=Monilinia vaccinii-corymbosi TaxID=61207 RepID=A0A8A3PL54_9HELO|nr:hypothetical protein DSL72_007257 [Monilinia vaccinii-corymbosi]